MKNKELLQRIEEEKNILYKTKQGRLTGFVTACVGIVFYDMLLKERGNGGKTRKKT
jgi:hypothetical protein